MEVARGDFEILNKKVMKRPLLSHPNFEKVFHANCDVSGVAIGAMLSQEGKLITLFNDKFMRPSINIQSMSKIFMLLFKH